MTQYAVLDYHVGDYLAAKETEEDAKAEAQQLSLEIGVASYNLKGHSMPVVIFVDGWPYYPRAYQPPQPVPASEEPGGVNV